MRAVPRGWWPIAAVSVIAVAVRLYRLDDVSLWTDELFTRFYPDAGLAYLWTDGLRTEPTSPLYYTLIWAVERLAGSAAWVVRAPSVAGVAGGVWLAWSLGRELFGRAGPGVLAGLLLALAPIDVLYAQEARSYALQGAALGLALLGFARVLRGGRRAGDVWRGGHPGDLAASDVGGGGGGDQCRGARKRSGAGTNVGPPCPAAVDWRERGGGCGLCATCAGVVDARGWRGDELDPGTDAMVAGERHWADAGRTGGGAEHTAGG